MSDGSAAIEAATVLFDRAPCGYIETDTDGVIVAINQTFLDWTGYARDDLIDRRTFADLLTPGGRIYHETHYAPMLAMQGHARQIALDIVCADKRRLPTLVNAVLEERGSAPAVVRTAVFDASDRRDYERELVAAKQRAETSERHARRLVETLQQTLIPPALPVVTGLDMAAAYRPAGDGTEIGGDFYDVFQIDADDWVVVIGDVQGKGVDAAVVTALARYTIRAAAVEHEGPAEVLMTLNRVLTRHDSGRISTAVVLRLHRDGDVWRVATCSAGHPLPLLRDGEQITEIGTSGSLLGFFSDITLTDTDLVLTRGQMLVLYTDGVSEARHDGAWFGDQRIVDVLHGARRDSAVTVTNTLLDLVLEFQRNDPRDDIAIVTIIVDERPAG